MDRYRKYNEKENIESSVFVMNTEESALSFVDEGNEYLNNLFEKLINEYDFPVDRAAIFYLFDRDAKSNTNHAFIKELIDSLSHSRESNGYSRQGLILLSYPSIESFVTSNFISDTHMLAFETGKDLKRYLNEKKIIQNNIDVESLVHAVFEMEKAFIHLGITNYDLDNFKATNQTIFTKQEQYATANNAYRLLSLLSIVLLDLGLVEVEH
ncbi:hypothetical protein [Radiobacillus sp. PE A8.2]|uniref:hypothetical protein n=1 Tax=Radiobacillus sp. PE A8.2 TaxID=3380349 RepID=UPI00388F89C9